MVNLKPKTRFLFSKPRFNSGLSQINQNETETLFRPIRDDPSEETFNYWRSTTKSHVIALFPVVKRSKILLFRNFTDLNRFRWKSGAEHTRELSRLPIYYKKRVQIKNFREFLVLEGRESTPSTWLFSLSTILIRCKNFEEFWRFEHRNSVWNASSNSKRHSRNPPCFIPRVIHSKSLFVHKYSMMNTN